MHLGVLRGTHEIKVIEHAINCNVEPFIPSGWEVEEHQKGGIVKFDSSKVDFFLSKKQKNGVIEGDKLREEMKGKNVLNANVLDYLLKNTHLIPESWKVDENNNTRYIFFWGTIYRSSSAYLFVRCLFWNDGEWQWSNGFLGNIFDSCSPSALASK